MANVWIISVCLALVLLSAESCFIPRSLHVVVPRNIPTAYKITKVETANCDVRSRRFTLTDPLFRIEPDGAVVASAPMYVGPAGRTFSVLAQDDRGPESEMEVHLVHSALQEREGQSQAFLKRFKRRWSPPPINILENDRGPFPKDLERLVSDSEATHSVYYTFSGPGYNEYPVGVFTLNSETGMLTVHRAVDREEFPKFILTARAFDKKTNQMTDRPLPVHILVDDVNDNAPEFTDTLWFTVPEHSRPGTVVGKVNTTDKDQANTLHVEIMYSLLTETNLFAIDPWTGVITTVTNTLDREKLDHHEVVVQIKDMKGAANGLFSTGTATISLGDINDNPPTFTKTSYEASVKENEYEQLILRIPVEDKDLVNTPNWISKFVITKGNENGNFRMDTDPKTNEGLLFVAKPLNHEKANKVRLEIMARNKADLVNTKEKWNSIPVDVIVGDVDEGPEFIAPTMRFTVKENTPNGTVIGTYTATDPETKSSSGIKYYKVTDPASWINVDRSSGELRVANTIDRESHFVQNGVYNITMKAVDASSKMGMGTVILVVEDVNDNMPLPPTGQLRMCEKEGELSSVVVVADDKDQSPFSSPFSFSMPKDNDGKWSVTKLNSTAAKLSQLKELPTGIYEVPVVITDLQGSGKTQTVTVKICRCKNGDCLPKDRSVSLGGLALLTMLLPLALLLLLCVLLALFCGTQGKRWQPEITKDSGGILLPSNTEGKGDEVDSAFLDFPPSGAEKPVKGSVKGEKTSAWPGIKGTGGIENNWINKTNVDMQEFTNSQYRSNIDQYGSMFGGQTGGLDFESRQLAHDSAFLHTWQTNGHYLHQKLNYMGTEEDGRYADDIIHSYGFEGVGSAAGSVGCCSDYADNGNLEFLNTLGPKFKTLAEVCTKTRTMQR